MSTIAESLGAKLATLDARLTKAAGPHCAWRSRRLSGLEAASRVQPIAPSVDGLFDPSPTSQAMRATVEHIVLGATEVGVEISVASYPQCCER